MARIKYTEPRPFANPTDYTVGKRIIRDGKPYVVTGIQLGPTNNRFLIYCMPAGTPMKLHEFVEWQKRREAGQVNVYCPGKELFQVHISIERE